MRRKHLLASWILAITLLIGLATAPCRAQALFAYPIWNLAKVGSFYPKGMAIAPDGTPWVTQGDNNIWLGNENESGVLYPWIQIPADSTGASPWFGAVITGPDGNMWLGDSQNESVWRVDPTNLQVARFAVGTAVSAMTVGPDGRIWFTSGGNQVGALALDGTLTLFTVEAGADLGLTQIISGADGNLWILASAYQTIGKVSTSGKILAQVALPSSIGGMVRGPDGAIWFTGNAGGAQATVFRINADNSLTAIATIPGASWLGPLAAGPDGNIWIGEASRPLLDRVTPSGAVSFFTTYIPDGNFPTPDNVTVLDGTTVLLGPGQADTLWFMTGSSINQLVLSDPSPLAASILPGGRSFQLGATPTVFASMANGSDSAMTNCRISNQYYVSHYQATDPATNAPEGTRDTPVTIPAHGTQTFVVTLKAQVPFHDPMQPLAFTCDGETAPTLPRLNTIDLYAAAAPTVPPDYIMLPASAQPGMLHVPVNGSAAFSVAIANLGGSPSPYIATVSANTGIELLPVTITMCLTDPSSGNCTTTLEPTLRLPADPNATMAVFLTANGPIPFAPAGNRIYLNIDYTNNDGSSVSHATTSLALEAD